MSPPAVPSAPPPPSAKRFRLDGPTRQVDRRVNALRADIADIALAGEIFAPHYARPLPRGCVVSSEMVRDAPDASARATSELLMGEAFDLIDTSGGWAWGSCGHDRYVGYLPATALGEPIAASHIVTARAALVFAEADIKAPVVARWPMGARFAGTALGAFLRVDAGFVHDRHVASIAAPAAVPVAIAEQLLGAPYLWGGRSGEGLDCSGLVQLALGLCGIPAPRDSDQQRATLGMALADDAALARGDLVFFPGHVGLMADAERIVHANAHAMAVTIEPLSDVVARLAKDHPRPILARRRLA